VQIRIKWLACGLLFSLPSLAYSAHSLSDTKKVSANVYEGTAGKTRLILTTKSCYHETPQNGEDSSFIWYERDGSISFSNADQCTVIAYREK
jgi:hypothetical protein